MLVSFYKTVPSTWHGGSADWSPGQTQAGVAQAASASWPGGRSLSLPGAEILASPRPSWLTQPLHHFSKLKACIGSLPSEGHCRLPKNWDYPLSRQRPPTAPAGGSVPSRSLKSVSERPDRSVPPVVMGRRLAMTQAVLLWMSALRQRIMGHSISNVSFVFVLCFLFWALIHKTGFTYVEGVKMGSGNAIVVMILSTWKTTCCNLSRRVR